MAKVLYIQASPRGEQSVSIRMAQEFLDVYRQRNPKDTIETLDLWATDLMPFTAPAAKAKYAVLGGGEPTGPDAEAWAKVIKVIEHFKSASKYVISTPMWNFGIPYRLKWYIDIIVQPALTFVYEDGQPVGLVRGRSAVLLMARGGEYSPESGTGAYDMQKPYLENILGYMGIGPIHSAVCQPTLAGADVQKAIDKGIAEARVLAEMF